MRSADAERGRPGNLHSGTNRACPPSLHTYGARLSHQGRDLRKSTVLKVSPLAGETRRTRSWGTPLAFPNSRRRREGGYTQSRESSDLGVAGLDSAPVDVHEEFVVAIHAIVIDELAP